MPLLTTSLEDGTLVLVTNVIRALAICLMVMAFFFGCERDLNETIFGEYRFFSSNGYNHYISLNGEVIVWPDVLEFCHAGDVILGERRPSELPDYEARSNEQDFGLFAIDIESGVIRYGLDQDHYQEALATEECAGLSRILNADSK